MGPEGFGIYVMTYPGDYHLSTILVRSIQQVSPDLPIMIIPGEGFDRNDHPFDVPILPLPSTGFWAGIGHQDRDFWAFQGPFETFLYLDADTSVVKSLDDLSRRISKQHGDFIYIHTWVEDEKWRHHYLRSFGSFRLWDRLRWSFKDFRKVFKLSGRWARIAARELVSRG